MSLTIVIIGAGEIGFNLARELSKEDYNITIVDINPEKVKRASENLDVSALEGNGASPHVLRQAQVEDANIFLALTRIDEVNLVASQMARKLGAKKIITLINRLNYLPMVQRVGITTTVIPRLTAVDRILRFVRKGRVISVASFREEEAESIELIATSNSKVVGKTLRDLRLPRECIIGAISRPNGEVVVPRGEDSIQPGDRVIFFALERSIPTLETAFFTERRR